LGTRRWSFEGGVTSHFATARTVAMSSAPWKRRRPVSISHSTMPAAKRSIEGLAGFCWMISGAR
jgi:hypothetical protein